MQKGVNQLGSGLTNLREHLRTKKSLEKENEELRTQLADAQENLNQVQLNQEELDNLKSLYDMDQNYADYDKIAANVIGKDAGNWFSVFLIDRGSNDGITVGMNVLADGGLAGIVIQVGPNYAKVRSIIDDNSNVSARNLSTSDLCVVSGSLKTMNESSLIDFDDLRDKEDQAKVGDQIVTSNISDMFWEGIPIGIYYRYKNGFQQSDQNQDILRQLWILNTWMMCLLFCRQKTSQLIQQMNREGSRL